MELLTNGTAEMNVAQILHGAAEEYLSQESWKCALIIENQLRFKGLRGGRCRSVLLFLHCL